MATIDEMAITPKGPSEYPLKDLSTEHFEALAFLLARDEYPEVVQVRRSAADVIGSPRPTRRRG